MLPLTASPPSRFNRPEKLNAFNAAMFEGFRAGLDKAEADESVRVVVFTGAGRAFSSGQDLTEKPAARRRWQARSRPAAGARTTIRWRSG